MILIVDFQAALQSTNSEEDKAILIAIKSAYWLTSKDIPLSKYESHINFLKQTCVDLNCLKLNEQYQYKSYYTANENLNAINEHFDQNDLLKVYL